MKKRGIKMNYDCRFYIVNILRRNYYTGTIVGFGQVFPHFLISTRQNFVVNVMRYLNGGQIQK